MSELISEEGEIYLWCLNKCNFFYKFNNEKVRYFGELLVCINVKFVNFNCLFDCRYGDIVVLIYLNGLKVKE